VQAQPHVATGGTNSGNAATSSGRKLPTAVAIPGYIITEQASNQEAQIIEELFEDLSIYELMEFGRSETVLGQNVVYQPIKNISDIYFTYNPKKILALQGTFDEIDSSVALKLTNYYVDGEISIDPATGDMLIGVDNLKDNFQIQVEILSAGEIKDS
jgi:hypothetical protein